MVDLYAAHNNLVDACADQKAEIQHLQNNIARLEDHSLQNNTKFRGILESVPAAELTNFLQRLMKALVCTLSNINLCIERAHWITKPKFLLDITTRDTLVRIYYFHVKERVIVAPKQNNVVPHEFTVSLYT